MLHHSCVRAQVQISRKLRADEAWDPFSFSNLGSLFLFKVWLATVTVRAPPEADPGTRIHLQMGYSGGREVMPGNSNCRGLGGGRKQ